VRGEVEAERRGQDLMLSDGQHLGQGGGVVVMRVKQRQASEEVRARCNIGIAFLLVKIGAEGGKRRLDLASRNSIRPQGCRRKRERGRRPW
jgi:hypothetical protein